MIPLHLQRLYVLVLKRGWCPFLVEAHGGEYLIGYDTIKKDGSSPRASRRSPIDCALPMWTILR